MPLPRQAWERDMTKRLTLLGIGFLAATAGLHAQQRLTLERLYSLPRLIGTEPKGFAWSRDSRRTVFLWNDEGTNFYDVWTLDVDNPVPVRQTEMPRRSAGAVTDPNQASLEQLATPLATNFPFSFITSACNTIYEAVFSNVVAIISM